MEMNEMASLPTYTVLEQSQVSPPPATLGERSLALTFFDISWLSFHPVETLFSYELPITNKQFTETVVPRLKSSLSITLQHFFPFAGNLIVYPSSPAKKPEIRYIEDDFVTFISAECNLDFKDLTGNHPRKCEKFYPLVPVLKSTANKESDFITTPLFSVQVTLFPNFGFTIGITRHHLMCDASTHFSFMKAWTSIARSGTDKLFLVNGTFPIYDRLVKFPTLDESFLRNAKVETYNQEYQPPTRSGPTNKVRSTFILTRIVINRLKNSVSIQLPTIPYLSSFTVACAYIWSCMAESRNDDLQQFRIYIDCRARMDPPIPVAYFGNCVIPCITIQKTTKLKGKEGFLTACRMLGENLYEMLTDKNGLVKDTFQTVPNGILPTTTIAVTGSPKLKFYEMDFGWGAPKNYETICIDYDQSISMYCCKESNEDLEIGVALSATEMEAFVRIFDRGLEAYV